MGSKAARRSILIINPNTTASMTESLKPLVDSLGFHDTRFDYFTAPSGVPSINNEEDASVSASACLPALVQLLEYDGFLVCCYSQHPLVPQLRAALHATGLEGKVVGGIFECSVAACLQSINANQTFGIVSTGKQWEQILGTAVAGILGSDQSARYSGTETTGFNADELHSTPREQVDQRMKEATKRLLKRGVKAICLGCAGMAGMRQVVQEACIEQLGAVDGPRIKVIDGVVSGAVFVQGALRALS